MNGPYDKRRKFNFNNTLNAPREAEPVKDDPLEEFLRFGAMAAPAIGTVGGGLIGAGIGSMAGGVGAVPGAGIGAALGGAAGTGLGHLAGYGADKAAEPRVRQEEERLRREQERAARSQAIMQLIGGM